MHKILIVDDEKPARDFIAELVVSYIPDAVVTRLDNPHKALICMQKEKYDMLFLDICMPGITGLELLEEIKRTAYVPYTVIISAHCHFDYAVKGIELGVARYITKPLHKEKIHEAISLYLKQTQMGSIELKIPKGVHRFEIKNLLALQTLDRGKIKVYTTDAIFPEVIGTLAKLHALLPSNFRYIRRDCILDYQNIKHFNLKTHEVTIVCQNMKVTFLASRSCMKQIKNYFQNEA